MLVMHCLLLSSNTTSLDMQLSQLFEVGITHSQPKIDSHSFTGTGHSQHQDYSCVCVLRVAVSINYWHSHVVCLKLASHTANLKLTPTHLQVQGTVSVKTTAVCVCVLLVSIIGIVMLCWFLCQNMPLGTVIVLAIIKMFVLRPLIISLSMILPKFPNWLYKKPWNLWQVLYIITSCKINSHLWSIYSVSYLLQYLYGMVLHPIVISLNMNRTACIIILLPIITGILIWHWRKT